MPHPTPTPVPTWLADVARRAASLGERLAGGGLDDPAGLERWRAAIAPDDATFFERRLAWDGLDPARLSGGSAPPPPDWLPWLAAALAEPPGPHPTEAADIPFIDLLWPFARVAGANLPADLALATARRLGEIAAPSLFAAFQASGSRYAAFVEAVAAERWRPLFEAWPVLARLLGTAMAQAAGAANELLTRFEADRPDLAVLLGADPVGLAGARPTSTDAHGGGRVVWRLSTLSGHELIYKPRTVATEAAFERLAEWLAQHGLPRGSRPIGVLDRTTHGWVELVAPEPCADETCAARYFRRAGRLLALFHALGASDFHWENVLAAGEWPAVVDLEGLLQPGLEPDEAGWDEPSALMRRVDQGALATLFLTFWGALPDGTAVDGGGLAPPPPAIEEQCWLAPNTDAMRPGLRRVEAIRPNLPLLAGRPALAATYAGDLRAGFREAHAALIEHRDALLAPDGPLAAFARTPVRFFFRATRHYELLEQRLGEPDLLVDGLARSFALDRLARTYRAYADRPPRWDLIGAERRALEQMDVPCFTLAAGATTLDLGLPGFAVSPLARARGRLLALDALDRQVQDQAIAITLAPGELLPPAAEPAPPPDWSPAQAALALAERLAARALPTRDGAVTWLAPVPHPRAARPVPGALVAGLWDGAPGVALFLAAAAVAGGPGAWADLALAGLRPVRQALAQGAARTAHDAAALARWASTARAMALVARWLDAPALADEARAIFRDLPPAALAACSHPDAAGGLAEVVASALAVDGEAALGVARRAGDRLLALAAPAGLAARGWRTDHGRGDVLAGFAHGQAGIATALLALADATGEACYRERALEALAYEDALFDPVLGNWPIKGSVGPDGRPVAWAAWCHGAAGIAIARVAAGRHDPDRAREAGVAIATVLAAPDHVLDLPCCGNFGRVEALLVAARGLARPELRAAAHALAARRHTVSDFGADPPRRELDLDPSMLRGLAGIGYTTLRLAMPETLPGLMGGH